MTTTDTVTLTYRVQRTITIDIDVTPDEAREAADMGETLTEYARETAACHPASAWTVVDETVMPS